MTTSGTTDFNPSGASLMLYAYSLCGLRRTAILPEHLEDARIAMGLMLAAWGNSTPNLWTVDLVEETLVAGTAIYDVDASTVMILDAYIRTGTGDSQVDRIIWPISRTEYASMPNKELEAPPTVFWFNRQLSPTITLWQTPDDQTDYTLRYYRCTVIQDINLANGEQVAIPQRWLDAFVWGLAARLAVSYAPDRAQALDQKAMQALTKAQEQDTEWVSTYIIPAVGGYYPR